MDRRQARRNPFQNTGPFANIYPVFMAEVILNERVRNHVRTLALRKQLGEIKS